MTSNQLNRPLDTAQPSESLVESDSPSEGEDPSMNEFHQLKQNLLLITLLLTGAIFISVWIFYSLGAALNYLLGACVGVVYLRMLAKDVEQLGGSGGGFGSTRLALFVALIIVATQRHQLQIVPIFLGFMTYKAAIIIYVLQTALVPARESK